MRRACAAGCPEVGGRVGPHSAGIAAVKAKTAAQAMNSPVEAPSGRRDGDGAAYPSGHDRPLGSRGISRSPAAVGTVEDRTPANEAAIPATVGAS
jgi:hypothetical protein